MQALYALLCLGLLGALQPAEHLTRNVIQLHRGKGVPFASGHHWLAKNCRRLSSLLRQKNAAVRKLETAATVAERDQTLSNAERLFQVHTLEVFQKELNESERSLFEAVLGLQRVLKGDFGDVANMRESSRQRLEALREAAIKVRQTKFWIEDLCSLMFL